MELNAKWKLELNKFIWIQERLKKTSEQFESKNDLTLVHIKTIWHSRYFFYIYIFCFGLRRSNTRYNALFKHERITWPVHCNGRSNVYILNIYNYMIISKLDWSRKRCNVHLVFRLRYIIPSFQIEVDNNW